MDRQRWRHDRLPRGRAVYRAIPARDGLPAVDCHDESRPTGVREFVCSDTMRHHGSESYEVGTATK
jgi:hypothetical protein